MYKGSKSLRTLALATVIGLGTLGTAVAQVPDDSDNTKGVKVTVEPADGSLSYGFAAHGTPATGTGTIDVFGTSPATIDLSPVIVEVSDTRSPAAAFQISVTASELDGPGDASIPASSVTMSSLATTTLQLQGSPVVIKGLTGATLDSPKIVVAKGPGGNVVLEATLGISIEVPAEAASGDYTGELTLSGTAEAP